MRQRSADRMSSHSLTTATPTTSTMTSATILVSIELWSQNIVTVTSLTDAATMTRSATPPTARNSKRRRRAFTPARVAAAADGLGVAPHRRSRRRLTFRLALGPARVAPPRRDRAPRRRAGGRPLPGDAVLSYLR